MAKTYMYELMKGSKKFICPNCGKKTFVPFVDRNNNFVDINLYGRCERINSCQYFVFPKKKIERSSTALLSPSPPPPPLDFIPAQLVEKSMEIFRENHLYYYAASIFGEEETSTAFLRYKIGSDNKGYTIFWQMDEKGLFRTGKAIYYKKDGKRDHDRLPYFVHNFVKRNFNFKQIFFGEHIVKESSNLVVLYESEKTAVLMSILSPNYTHIAAGGAGMINTYKLCRLPRLNIVSPDHLQVENWKKKTQVFSPKIDKRAHEAAEIGELPSGADLWDWVLNKIRKQDLRNYEYF